MLNLLEIAINEIEVNEIDEALDNLLEFEYTLFELERTDQTEKALDLLSDIIKMLRQNKREAALTYCHILIDFMLGYKQSPEIKKILKEIKTARGLQP